MFFPGEDLSKELPPVLVPSDFRLHFHREKEGRKKTLFIHTFNFMVGFVKRPRCNRNHTHKKREESKKEFFFFFFVKIFFKKKKVNKIIEKVKM